MSGTLPSTPGFSNYVLESNQPTVVSIGESARRQSRTIAAHLWVIKVVYPTLQETEFRPILAFAIAQRGRAESFQIVLPRMKPLGVATGSPVVNGAHTVGDNTVGVSGFTIDTIGIMKAGDIVKFANHSKVYMVVVDANSDGTGNTVLTIEPPLIEPLADLEVVTVNDVPFTVSFANDIQTFKTNSPSLSTYELDLIEAIV